MKKFSVISFTMSLLLLVMFFGVGGVAFAQSIDNIGNDLVKCGGPNDYLHPEDNENACYYEVILTQGLGEGEDGNPIYTYTDHPTYGTDKPLLNHCQGSDIFGLLHRIVNLIIFTISPAIVVTILIITGVMLTVPSGNPGLKAKNKDVVKYAILGYALILSAWLIINTFLNVVGVAEWTGLRNWWKLDVGAENRIKPISEAIDAGESIKVRGARGGSVKISEISGSDALESVTAIIDNKLYQRVDGDCPSSQDQPTEQIESSE